MNTLSRRIAIYSWVIVLLATNITTGAITFFVTYNQGWDDAANSTSEMQIRQFLKEKAQRELPPHRVHELPPAP